MAERYRIRCPVCHMMPFTDDIQKLEDEEKAVEFGLFVLKFGGKVAGGPLPEGEIPVRKKRGSAKGAMSLQPFFDQALSSEMIAIFKKRAKKFLEMIK